MTDPRTRRRLQSAASSGRPRRWLVTGLLAFISLLAAAGAQPAGAATRRPPLDDAAKKRQEVRQRRAQVASQIDVLKSSDSDVQEALDAVEANVKGQQARVDAARRAAGAATERLLSTRRAEQLTIADLERLRSSLVRLAVDAYVSPRPGGLLSSLNATSLAEASRGQELLKASSENGADVAEALGVARADLETQRQAAESAQTQARQRQRDVEARLAELKGAEEEQQRLADQVEARLDEALSEADALAGLDLQLSQQIAQRQAALARRVAGRSGTGAGRSAARGGAISLTTVRGITVNSSIARQLESLLAAAEADGFTLSGGGYRDPAAQVAVRRSNCGSSDYAVYNAPPSSCRPPTARPGSSQHELGLAIDFTWNGSIISSRSNAAFKWLAGHAGRYGLSNLPSEPWHWSTSGR
jgi:LAS superfamily LD-carboxypeptidase LdcB